MLFMEFDWTNFPFTDYAAAKSFASSFYSKIGRIKCPALDDEYVAFTRKGIGHILYKSSRNHKDIVHRLSLLQHAEAIIMDPYAKIEYRLEDEKEYLKKNGEYKLYEVKSQYWTFKKQINPSLTVKVVVRQVEQGGKYFYSIMKYDGP